MKPDLYRPVMCAGCTVRLVPAPHRVGALLPGILPYQPYRCVSIKGNMIEILADDKGNTLLFLLKHFEAIGNKYALYEYVTIFDKKRNIYSPAMVVVGFSDKFYTLNNGQKYATELLFPASKGAATTKIYLPVNKTVEQRTLFE